MRTSAVWGCLSLWCGLLVSVRATAADPPSVKLALTFRPVQKDVDYETPDVGLYDKCEVKLEPAGSTSGWIVIGPNGQTLRRFVDSNGDNIVDQWRYFNHGLEVYRDIDTNKNNKVDQSRWLNTAGSRWGIDSDEDGQIDEWKVLSAEEASREAIRALVARDEDAMERLVINRDDIRKLGIEDDLSKKLLESISDVGSKVRDSSALTKSFNTTTRWMRFDGAMPGVIPSDAERAKSDLLVYENAMAIVETDGEPGLVQIGELIRVGDVWKLTQVPQPLKGNSVQVTQGGILMQPTIAGESVAAAPAAVNTKTQKLVTELQQLDEQSPAPTASRSAISKFHDDRAELLQKLIAASETDAEREQWTRQLADSIAAAVQGGTYSDGLKRLTKLESDVTKSSPGAPVLEYITYRRLLAEYSLKLQTADPGDGGADQEWWLKELAAFVEKFPNSDDAAEAMIQLANTNEFLGKLDDARKWYVRVAKDHANSEAADRAQGALRRLDLKGKILTLSGPGLDRGTIDVSDYRGKVVLVYYWATWCGPCTEDLPRLRALYDQYHRQGFEIIGVNIDMTVEGVRPYLSQNKVTWPQIHQDGGFDSEPAKYFGIILPPTLFLVDRTGRVIDVNLTMDDLKARLVQLWKKK